MHVFLSLQKEPLSFACAINSSDSPLSHISGATLPKKLILTPFHQLIISTEKGEQAACCSGRTGSAAAGSARPCPPAGARPGAGTYPPGYRVLMCRFSLRVTERVHPTKRRCRGPAQRGHVPQVAPVASGATLSLHTLVHGHCVTSGRLGF